MDHGSPNINVRVGGTAGMVQPGSDSSKLGLGLLWYLMAMLMWPNSSRSNTVRPRKDTYLGLDHPHWTTLEAQSVVRWGGSSGSQDTHVLV